jgi:uroporphyrinogen-III synthase
MTIPLSLVERVDRALDGRSIAFDPQRRQTEIKMSSLRSTSRPLAGATVVVTRPSSASAALSRRVRLLGGSVLRLPGLALRGVASSADALSKLGEAQAFDACIFSSPAAVRHAWNACPSLQVAPRSGVFAIGAGTARALARHGIGALVPDERSDSEGLLGLPGLAIVDGRRIALVGAPGGRDLIAPTLRRRGAAVDEIHVYERTAPRLTRGHFDALAHADDPLITLLSSADALGHLVALLPAPLLLRLQRQSLVVSSLRLVDIAGERGFTSVFRAASATPAALVDGAARALAHHRL